MPNFKPDDIILPRDKVQSKDWASWALLVVGYDEQGRLLAHPMGGGFHKRFDEAAMRKYAFVKAPAKLVKESPFYRTEFTGDWLPEGVWIPGWTDGRLWNGWATPHFEFKDAMRLIKYQNADPSFPKGRYDEERDAFVIEEEDEDPDVIEAVTINVPGARGRPPREVKVYPIGAFYWTWEERRPEHGTENDDD